MFCRASFLLQESFLNQLHAELCALETSSLLSGMILLQGRFVTVHTCNLEQKYRSAANGDHQF